MDFMRFERPRNAKYPLKPNRAAIQLPQRASHHHAKNPCKNVRCLTDMPLFQPTVLWCKQPKQLCHVTPDLNVPVDQSTWFESPMPTRPKAREIVSLTDTMSISESIALDAMVRTCAWWIQESNYILRKIQSKIRSINKFWVDGRIRNIAVGRNTT
jgi:hypothetical protein